MEERAKEKPTNQRWQSTWANLISCVALSLRFCHCYTIFLVECIELPDRQKVVHRWKEIMYRKWNVFVHLLDAFRVYTMCTFNGKRPTRFRAYLCVPYIFQLPIAWPFGLIIVLFTVQPTVTLDFTWLYLIRVFFTAPSL